MRFRKSGSTTKKVMDWDESEEASIRDAVWELLRSGDWRVESQRNGQKIVVKQQKRKKIFTSDLSKEANAAHHLLRGGSSG
jgi:hypothetical protein